MFGHRHKFVVKGVQYVSPGESVDLQQFATVHGINYEFIRLAAGFSIVTYQCRCTRVKTEIIEGEATGVVTGVA